MLHSDGGKDRDRTIPGIYTVPYNRPNKAKFPQPFPAHLHHHHPPPQLEGMPAEASGKGLVLEFPGEILPRGSHGDVTSRLPVQSG